jgi:hypothetical protein
VDDTVAALDGIDSVVDNASKQQHAEDFLELTDEQFYRSSACVGT